jgi:hypothetical protein
MTADPEPTRVFVRFVYRRGDWWRAVLAVAGCVLVVVALNVWLR